MKNLANFKIAVKTRECLGCDKFVNEDFKYPKITNSYKRVFSEETAFQMTNILKGAVERGTEGGRGEIVIARERKNEEIAFDCF